MSINTTHTSPADWFLTPAGRYLGQWALETADSLLVDVFGLQAAQIGCESLDFLARNRIQHRFRCITSQSRLDISRQGNTPRSVQTDASALPFESDSLDLVVLPYVLEFHEDPHRVLREAYRVLRPEGQLLIMGFNPVSLWGLRNYLAHCTNAGKTTFPWPGNYLSALRLKDWLKLLDFEVARGHFGCYAPPCKKDVNIQRLHFLELAGNRWWGFAGGSYALMAIKRMGGMTLVTPSWASTQKKLQTKSALVAEQHQISKTP